MSLPYADSEKDKKNIIAFINNNIKNNVSGVTVTTTYNSLILEEIGKGITKLLSDTHQTIDDSTESVEWNNTYNCWEYSVAIKKEDSKPFDPYNKKSRFQSSLEGRIIRVKIFNPSSNTQQNSQDYINRINNLANSGINLIEKLFEKAHVTPDIQNKIRDIKTKCSLLEKQLASLEPSNPEAHKVAIQCFQMLNSHIAATLKVLNKKYDVVDPLKKLGYIHSKTDRRCKKGVPKTTKNWLKILATHEARFTSLNKRDVLVNVYPLLDDQGKTSPIWTINYNLPLSDVPSTLRNAAGKVLPNWFRSTTNIFKVENNKAKSLESFTAERSSSFSAIAVDKLFRRQYTTDIAKNKLRLLVRNKIIEKLNQLDLSRQTITRSAIEDILQECFKQELVVTTLLNLPFKHKKENFLPEAFSEGPQFKDGKVALESIASLYLEESDVDYILKHIKIPSAVSQYSLLAYLQQQKIICTPVFHNFASSVLRKLSREKSYNQESLRSVMQWMQEYLNKHNILVNDSDFTQLKNIQQLQAIYEQVDDMDVKKTLSLYIKYIELLKKSSNAKQDNFLIQVFSSLLTNRLGKEIHITCKSGEDRTGATLVAIDCALATIENMHLHKTNFNIHAPNEWDKFRNDFWKNYIKTEEFSASRDITDMNAVGARGLQSQSKILKILMSVVSPIYKKLRISDKMARISKVAFKKSYKLKERQHFFELVKLKHGEVNNPLTFASPAAITTEKKPLTPLRKNK